MIYFIKRLISWFKNSKTNPVRDKTGKIIDDWKRRKDIKETMKKLKSGELKRPGFHGEKITYSDKDGPRNYTVETKSRIVAVGIKENKENA